MCVLSRSLALAREYISRSLGTGFLQLRIRVKNICVSIPTRFHSPKRLASYRNRHFSIFRWVTEVYSKMKYREKGISKGISGYAIWEFDTFLDFVLSSLGFT